MPDVTTRTRILSVADALCEALDLCLAADERVYVIGEGVADPKAIFGTTKGLVQKYGPERVVEMPVAENALTGVAIGSAIMGRRPVLVHQRVDFSLLSIEQLFNNAAKTCYVTRGRHTVPLVVRMVIGRGWGQGPAHSQSLESVFAHVPGLKVVMPSSPRSAKGLLIAAIEDPNPVLMIEHRWIHYVSGEVPAGRYTLPLEGAEHVTAGGDITVVAGSYMRYEAAAATAQLEKAGISVDLFDLSVLRPLDASAIVASVRRTGRLMTVDTGWMQFGIGAEIVARVTEQAFGALAAAPVRLGLADHPTPSSRALAKAYYPTALEIASRCAELVELPDERRQELLRAVERERANAPIDVPNPAFRGPF